MNEQNNNSKETGNIVEKDPKLPVVSVDGVGINILNNEAQELINKLVVASTPEEIEDITQLFNTNQSKKNLVRTNKLNSLYDSAVGESIRRITNNPDAMSNQELITLLKTVQDLICKSQNVMNADTENNTLIQVNDHKTIVNFKDDVQDELDENSRKNVKDFFANLKLTLQNNGQQSNIIDAKINETQDEKESE